MPLTPSQFDLRVTPETERWMRSVHSFLHDHFPLAYSVDELLENLATGPTVADRAALCKALKELAYLAGVDERGTPGDMYYRSWEDVPEFADPPARSA